MVLAAYACLLFFDLGGGSLSHTDEYRTAERSREFHFTGDWATVHNNFAPHFAKPPLQYWLTALTLPLTEDREWAVRFWPALGALAALAATAWLAWVVGGKAGWAPLLAALFCLLNLGFTVSGRSGWLDSWMMAFNTAAIAAALEARSTRNWWWVVAACIALGAWQKAPVAALLVGGLCLAGILRSERGFLRCAAFWKAILVAFALTALWPLWQWSRHGDAFLHAFFVKEMVHRTGFASAGSQKFHPGVYFVMLWDSWSLLAPASCAALAMIPLTRARRDRGLALLGLLVLALFVTLSLMAFRSERYASYVVPMLSVILAVVVARRFAGWKLVACVSLLTIPAWLELPSIYDARHHDRRPQAKLVAMDLGRSYRAGERLLLLRKPKSRMRTDVMLFYGDLPAAVTTVDAEALDRGLQGMAETEQGFRGIVDAGCWSLLRSHFPGARREGAFGDYIHWWAPARDASASTAGRRCAQQLVDAAKSPRSAT